MQSSSAGLYALLVIDHPVEIVADSRLLCNGPTLLLEKCVPDLPLDQQPAWTLQSHADVWACMWGAICQRGPASVRVRHVNSPLHKSAIASGCISPLDYASVDELAVKAVRAHRAPINLAAISNSVISPMQGSVWLSKCSLDTLSTLSSIRLPVNRPLMKIVTLCNCHASHRCSM